MGHFELHSVIMRCSVLLSCLVAVTLAQTPPAWFDQIKNFINGIDDTIDSIHGFRMEYHHDGRQHLLIAIMDKPPRMQCHFIEVSPVWESLLTDRSKVPQISEEIYHLIRDPNTQETTLTDDQILAAYGDSEAATECVGHTIKVLSYSPSNAIMSG